MTNRSLRAVHEALAQVQTAMEQRNSNAAGQAIEIALLLTENPEGEEAIALRIESLQQAAILALVQRDSARVGAMTNEIATLLPGILQPSRREMVTVMTARLREDAGLPPIDPVSVGRIALLLALDLPTTTSTLDPMLVRSTVADPAAIDRDRRHRIAMALVQLADDVSCARRSGEAIAWLEETESFLTGLPYEAAMPLIARWGSILRREAVARRSQAELDDTNERQVLLVRALGAPPPIEDAAITQLMDAAELDRAFLREDGNAVRIAAERIMARPDFAHASDATKAQIRSIATSVDGDTLQSSKPTLKPPLRDDPGYNMWRLADATQRLARDLEDGVAAFIELLVADDLEGDYDLRTAIPQMLGRILYSAYVEGDMPVGHAAVAMLKVSVREHESVRLEIIAHARDRVSALDDRIVRDAYVMLRDLLVSQGRIGEAIRIAGLLEQEDRRIPHAASEVLAALAGKRVPFTRNEEAFWESVKSTAVLVQKGLTRVTPMQWLLGLNAFAADSSPASAAQGSVDEDGWVGAPGIAQLGYLIAQDRLLIRCRYQSTPVIRSIPLVSPQILFKAVYDLEQACRAPLPTTLDTCRKLYQILVAPVEDVLRDSSITTLSIEAAGCIPRVPFAALHDGKDYLIRRFAFAMHGKAPQHRSANGGTASILAVSKTPGQSPLNMAIRDMETVCGAATRAGLRLFARHDGQVTSAILSEALRLAPSLCQISAHFEADPADMGRSAFILGDAHRATLAEFAMHDLSSIEMMLLMGCGSASRSDRDDGGLDIALLRLGAQSVLGSLWRIDDDVASFVLERFLDAWLDNGLSKAAALRETQLAVLDNEDEGLRHPHYWAPYILSGGWQ